MAGSNNGISGCKLMARNCNIRIYRAVRFLDNKKSFGKLDSAGSSGIPVSLSRVSPDLEQ